jgi:hypothetical protein
VTCLRRDAVRARCTGGEAQSKLIVAVKYRRGLRAENLEQSSNTLLPPRAPAQRHHVAHRGSRSNAVQAPRLGLGIDCRAGCLD